MGVVDGSPLDGVRALELPGGVATRYCGRLLAMLGADVVVAGQRDDAAIGYAGDAGRAYGRWLDHGKRREPAGDGGVDLVVAGMDAAGVAAGESVASRTGGRAVLVAIRWFAAGGPYARWPGSDEVVLALGGLAHAFGEVDGPPTLAQGHAPQLIAGANACTAALAALLAPAGARPQRVDVDVFESTMCLSETGAAAAVANPGTTSLRLGVNRFSPTYPCSSYRTSDGWVGVTCLTPAQWGALCEAVGRPDLAADPGFATTYRRLLAADEIDAALAPAIAARPTAAWLAEGDRRRIPITPMPTPVELPHQEHWHRRGSFGPVAGEGEGAGELLGPTLPFRARFDGEPVGRWLPAPGATGPLAGVRVVDFTMGWAGPLTTRALGDLGADVVKIESVNHPDWWRGWEASADADPPSIEVQPHFNAMNRNKRGVALDLRTAEGGATARALLATADVVVDNFAAGVLDKLGFGPDEQRRLQPGVVSLSMPAFGSGGPLSGLRAYGSTVEQASGLPFVNGRPEWPPCLQHVAFGDAIAGVYGALAVLAALHGRERLGGADLELAQVACLFEMAADAVLAAQVDGGVARTGNRRRRLAGCSVVPTDSGAGWLAVVVDAAHAAPLRDLVGAGEDADEDAVEAATAAWAAGLPAEAAAALLHERGIGAAPVVPAHRLGADPHLLATGYWQALERPHVGRHVLGAPPYRFDGERPAPRRPAPTLGQHTTEVVAELGEAPR